MERYRHEIDPVFWSSEARRPPRTPGDIPNRRNSAFILIPAGVRKIQPDYIHARVEQLFKNFRVLRCRAKRCNNFCSAHQGIISLAPVYFSLVLHIRVLHDHSGRTPIERSDRRQGLSFEILEERAPARRNIRNPIRHTILFERCERISTTGNTES